MKTRLNVQETPGWFTMDGCGCWSIFFAKTFREILAESLRRGQLYWNGEKVIRFEGDFLPVVSEETGGQMSLAIPGGGWECFAM